MLLLSWSISACPEAAARPALLPSPFHCFLVLKAGCATRKEGMAKMMNPAVNVHLIASRLPSTQR